MAPGPIPSRNRVRSSLPLLPLLSAVLCFFGPVAAFPQHTIPSQESQIVNASVSFTDILTPATPNPRISSGTTLPLIYPPDRNVLTSQMRDWWVQDGASFLNEYITEFRHTKVYAEEGLVKSLMRCFLTNGQSQNDECPEIRQHFASRSGEQKAKLVVDGVAKFLALFGTSSEAQIASGFKLAGENIENMEYTSRWFNQLSSDDRYELHVKNIQSLICSIFLTAIPWKSTTVWSREAEIAFQEAAYLGSQAAFANSDQSAKSLSPNKWDQLFETPVGVSQLDDIRRTDDISIIGDSAVDDSTRKENEAMKVASERLTLIGTAIGIVKNESFETAQEKTWTTLKLLADYCAREAKYSHRLQDKLNGYTAREFYEASGILAMSSIEKAMAELASGRLSLGGSNTPAIIDLLSLGNLLDISTDNLLAEAAEADQHVANRLLQRAVNFALKEDKTWVTCTSDFMNRENKKVSRCEADTSGPQDCKACLAIPKPEVCYMYQWTRVSVIPLLQNNDEGRNTKPVQFDHWKTRFNINPTDIVISSVLSHDMQSPNYRLLPNQLPMTNTLNTSFGALSTAAAPGAFTLPICNSRYNFNSHYLDPSTKDYRIDVDYSRHRAYGASKSLPCNCGPWGSETESVWSAAGLNLNDGWLTETCQFDILKKIRSPIERYVALCRIGRRGSYIRKNGKAADCDAVINTIDRLGVQEEKEIDPLTRLAIHCQINGNTKGRCRAYKQTWKDLVNKANEWKSQGGEVGADNVEVTKKTTELGKEDLVLLQRFESEKDAKEAKGDSGDSHFE